jgi:hypothetical protein
MLVIREAAGLWAWLKSSVQFVQQEALVLENLLRGKPAVGIHSKCSRFSIPLVAVDNRVHGRRL